MRDYTDLEDAASSAMQKIAELEQENEDLNDTIKSQDDKIEELEARIQELEIGVVEDTWRANIKEVKREEIYETY